jgi:serine/threonine-protein kinase
MYEMFSGSVPFTGESAISVGFQHLKESCQSLKTIQNQVPDQLSGIVDRLLQKDPSHRYQSVRDLKRDLEQLHSFKPVEAQKTAEKPGTALEISSRDVN